MQTPSPAPDIGLSLETPRRLGGQPGCGSGRRARRGVNALVTAFCAAGGLTNCSVRAIPRN